MFNTLKEKGAMVVVRLRLLKHLQIYVKFATEDVEDTVKMSPSAQWKISSELVKTC